MKIFYDDTKDLIIIEGLKQVFAPQSLVAVITNNKIAVRLINETVNILGPVEFNTIQDKNGATHNNILNTHQYLAGEFAKSGIPDDLDLVSIFESNL